MEVYMELDMDVLEKLSVMMCEQDQTIGEVVGAIVRNLGNELSDQVVSRLADAVKKSITETIDIAGVSFSKKDDKCDKCTKPDEPVERPSVSALLESFLDRLGNLDDYAQNLQRQIDDLKIDVSERDVKSLQRQIDDLANDAARRSHSCGGCNAKKDRLAPHKDGKETKEHLKTTVGGEKFIEYIQAFGQAYGVSEKEIDKFAKTVSKMHESISKGIIEERLFNIYDLIRKKGHVVRHQEYSGIYSEAWDEETEYEDLVGILDWLKTFEYPDVIFMLDGKGEYSVKYVK